MGAFRRAIYAALCSGLICGTLAAMAHQVGTVPLILAAERYEQPELKAPHSGAPESRLERASYTLITDLLAAIGFALLLAAGLQLHGGEAGWREGLFWGLGGFAAFTLAPGIGLPPELPGTATAPLVARQFWWLATAAATGTALALFAFVRRPSYAALAAILIVLPHLYGAPQPAEATVSILPEPLAHRFGVMVTVVSFLFWAALGASTGYFYRRFAQQAD